MGRVSFRIPDSVKEEMEEYSWINWSALMRLFIYHFLRRMEEDKTKSAWTRATREIMNENTDVDMYELKGRDGPLFQDEGGSG